MKKLLHSILIGITAYLLTKAVLYALGTASLIAFTHWIWPYLRIGLLVMAGLLGIYLLSVLITACILMFKK
ncbi:MAG: hypothetical protein IJI38_06775 [Clostridia bacterium]|nr:hypothetical protein [Clostridia bacterium]